MSITVVTSFIISCSRSLEACAACSAASLETAWVAAAWISVATLSTSLPSATGSSSTLQASPFLAILLTSCSACAAAEGAAAAARCWRHDATQGAVTQC